jgi:chitodextrinase
MKAPSATQNTVNLQVDTSACYSVGGGSLVAGSWATNSSNWINYQNGAPSNVVTLSLPAGAHTLKYIGAQAGVEIDRVIMTSDSSCTPSGVGTNCESGDSTAPTISLQVLSAGQPVTAGQTVNGSLTMNATAADASGIANVQFLVDGNAVSTDTSSPYSFSWNSATTSNGSHTLSARATDTKNNAATSTNLAVNVSNTVSCTGTPSVPGNLHVTSTSANAVGLAWNASTPAAGCNLQGYKVFRNGTQVAAPTGTTYTDSGLTPGTTYNYTVAAIDTGNHVSGQSTAASGVTAADTTAPSVPANLRSTLKTASSVALAWDASTDNTGVKDYVIYRNGTQVGTSTTASFTDSALVPNTAYSFTVKARDLANNLSAASSALSVTTLSGTNANKGDLNTDNKVNLTDLAILLAHWQQAGVPITQGDVNSSGKVDLVDLAMLLSNWNKTL